MEKYLHDFTNHAEIKHQKLVQDPFLILVKNPKQSLRARNCFKIILKEDYQKALNKSTLFFPLNPISFNEQDHEKQKGPQTSDHSLIRL